MEEKYDTEVLAMTPDAVREVYEYYARSGSMRTSYNGEYYFFDTDGPGPSVRKSFDNTGDPIFTLPEDEPFINLLDKFKLDGVSVRELLDSGDERFVVEHLY